MNTKEQLREQAEMQLTEGLPLARARSAESLLHELQVHQIELEMQNENLRQSQVALEESRDRYRDLYDFSPLGLFTLNREGMIYEMNHAAAVLLRMERKLLLRQRFSRYIAAPDVERWQKFVPKILNSDLKQSCELNLRRIDGSAFPVHLDCLRIEDGQGTVTIRIALFDITEREKAETNLRESEEKFRAIFDGTFDGIMLVDEAGMIVEYNREILRLSGMTDEQFKKMRVWDFRPADKVELAKGVFLNAIKTGTTGSAEFKYKKPDGKVIYVEARGARIIIGERSYLKCLVRDITERKAAETEIQEYQRLLQQLAAQSSANREAELKSIAREIHDELGQLMSALRMDISLLRIQFAGDNPALMNLIKDMLSLIDKAIAAVRDVTSNLRPAALDMGMAPAIQWLAEEFSMRTGTKCDVQIAGVIEGLSEAQTLTLFRIVQESLTNVTRHAKAKHVTINAKQCAECVCITIRDDGVGFDPRAMPAKKSFGLMGIKERALAAGGNLEVTSTPGQGTSLSIIIPPNQKTPGRRRDD